jgi:trigger factor
MVEHNHIPEMVSEVLRGKALATVVQAAKVTDESGNEVDLKNLMPDGTLAEPGDGDAAEEPAAEATGEPAAAEETATESAVDENGAEEGQAQA